MISFKSSMSSCPSTKTTVCTSQENPMPVITFLPRPDVQETLGAKGSWSSCNMLANKLYIADFMKNYHNEIANLLENGLQVLIYAGDVDYICNWLGNKKWVKALEWGGKEGFNAAEDENWTL